MVMVMMVTVIVEIHIVACVRRRVAVLVLVPEGIIVISQKLNQVKFLILKGGYILVAVVFC